MKFLRIIFLSFICFLSNNVFSQNIKNLNFDIVEKNIVLTFDVSDENFFSCIMGACALTNDPLSPNFINQSSLRTNIESIKYSSEIYFKVSIDDYEGESMKIDLPEYILNNIKLGKNTVNIDIEKYLNNYIGYDDLIFEFEVKIVETNFIPVYFEIQTDSITIDKWDENLILRILNNNLHYIKYYNLSNLSFKISRNGNNYLEGYIDQKGKFLISRINNSDREWEGEYLIQLSNSGYGNDSYLDKLYLSKKEAVKKEKKNPTRDKKGIGIFINYSSDNVLSQTGYSLPLSANQSGYLPDILYGIEGFLPNSKFSVGFIFGIETSEFPTYQNGLWLITNPPPQLFETSELSNQLYALTIGHQIGKSPFNLKITLGTNNYNFETERVTNAGNIEPYWEFSSAFYGSAGMQLFIGRGNSSILNGEGKSPRITAEIYITTLGTIGYGFGLVF